MNTYPTGTVTFLFTDIEGSTKLWQEHPEGMKVNLARHDELLRSVIERNEGYVFKTVGDAFCAAFPTALQGVKAAVESQQALAQTEWGEAVIKVRMGLHTGDAEERDHDYFGNTLNRVARLMSAGHGGQTLISLATQELIRDKLPSGVSLVDLGERRLKDLIRPEHIYQLNVEGLRDSFPPLKTLDAYRHNLPAQTTSFIGREKEITEIKQAISEHRLVTLTGPGGTGKTRLSLQVAADMLDQFHDGVWFIELAPITDPDLIPQTTLAAVGLQIQSGKTAEQSLLDALGEKTSLLVLDNCEHLIEACAQLADALLASAPRVKILASSREALGIRGEQTWRVPSLTLPDVKHLPPVEQVSQFESVRLFIERARLVQPHFDVNSQNAPAIAQICHRLDGIPLAIELAAARIRMLSAEEISTRLDDRFRLLTGGSRTALPRQQTLRALIDWSYDMLSEDEQTLLRRLAVFSGGCTLHAAESVCPDENPAGISSYDVLDLLTHLVDKSLVALDEHPAQSRYRILETVRQYAREKLMEAGEGEAVRQKHFDYFYALAAEAEPYMLFGPTQLERLDQLEDDLGNFYAALEWSLENKMATGADLNAKLCWFWDRRGHWVEGYEWTRRALELITDKTGLRAKLLAEAAWLANELVYRQRSLDHAYESVALYRELGDKAGLAVPLLILGDEFRDQSEWEKAMQYYTESYALFEESQNKWGCRMVLLNGFATLAEKEEKYDELEKLARQALQFAQEAKDTEGISYATFWLGQHALFINDHARAKEFHAEALRLARAGKYPDLLTICVRANGHLAYLSGDYKEAQVRFEEFHQIAEDLGDKSSALFALRRLGHLARIQGDLDRTRKYYAEILSRAHEVEERRQTFGTLLELAFMSEQAGAFAKSARMFGAVETLYPIVYKGMSKFFFAECEQTKEECRKELGEEIYAAAYTEGRAMTLEQVIAYALEETQ
jgi:predicted ATPase/class 3 adenylate cyclase